MTKYGKIALTLVIISFKFSYLRWFLAGLGDKTC